MNESEMKVKRDRSLTVEEQVSDAYKQGYDWMRREWRALEVRIIALEKGLEDRLYQVRWESVRITTLEERIIALERGLEAVLRRMEVSTSPDDEPGWFGVTE